MEKFISKLREKPETEKKRILFISLFVVMAIIVSLWLYGLTHTLTPKVVKETKDEVKPFELLGLKFRGTYENITASVNKAKFLKKDQVENNIQSENTVDLVPVYK